MTKLQKLAEKYYPKIYWKEMDNMNFDKREGFIKGYRVKEAELRKSLKK